MAHHTIESRQGLIYGPFNQVYGFGAVLMTLLLAPLIKKNTAWIFIGSGLIGGLFEALCSLIQEAVWGAVTWKYSGYSIPLFGGRTCLLYMLFWAILGTVYMRLIYPLILKLITRVSKCTGRFFTWLVSIFLILDMAISSVAAYRWLQRQIDPEPRGAVSTFLDKYYPDEFMRGIYPNVKIADIAKAVNGGQE